MPDKNGAILNIEMRPTPDGWRITLIHRTPDGRGIYPVQHTTPNFDRAVELISTRVAVDGIETQPPSPKGRP